MDSPPASAQDGSVSLNALAVGHSGRVVTLSVPGAARARLMELGLTPGVLVSVVRFAPLGDPVEVRVRGYSLSLRKAEAEGIRVIREPV